jgi:hypothetical protein
MRHVMMRVSAALCVAAALGAPLAGCATRPEPISATEAARIRQACPKGSFIGSMTSNCPEIAR